MMRDSYRIAHMLNVCHFPPGIYVITATMECIVVQTLAEVLENPSGYLGVIVVGIDVPKEEVDAACLKLREKRMERARQHHTFVLSTGSMLSDALTASVAPAHLHTKAERPIHPKARRDMTHDRKYHGGKYKHLRPKRF